MSNMPPRPEPKRTRSFVCRDELYLAFEARARALECSVDWLLAEAMKRFLAQTGTGIPPRLDVRLPPPERPSLPPPPPPRRASRSDVHAAVERIALRLGTERVVVDRDRFVIGRKRREASFVVADPNVSRQHAMLERTAHGWVVVDMASANGVHVNGTRVTRGVVRAGDVLGIGPVRILVERA